MGAEFVGYGQSRQLCSGWIPNQKGFMDTITIKILYSFVLDVRTRTSSPTCPPDAFEGVSGMGKGGPQVEHRYMTKCGISKRAPS